jgi:2-polyprenyl-3-methyl-5-hydroxy-6-metoxy-1,4-benzoquinol methylase
MASVKDHYDTHLAHFYEWMTGDFDSVRAQFQRDFERLGLISHKKAIAVDLGCGHGPGSVALNNLGFKVYAIDFNAQLLESLKYRDSHNEITVIESDLRTFRNHVPEATLIVCMGDTVAHLSSFEELKALLTDCYAGLTKGGKLMLAFRDYATELHGTSRFIPVKADEGRILTCMLEYNDTTVTVTDLLHERSEGQWIQKASSYTKLRLRRTELERMVIECGFELVHREQNRMVYLLAEKT